MTSAPKLAAILAADVVGYSRMMGEDGAGQPGRSTRVTPFLDRDLRRPERRNDRSRSGPAVRCAQIAAVHWRLGERVKSTRSCPSFRFQRSSTKRISS